MIRRFKSGAAVWHKIENDPKALLFLRSRELYCVAASARFLSNSGSYDHAWSLQDGRGRIIALLIHSKRSFFPVFNSRLDIPIPRFMDRFLRKIALHAIQGLQREVEVLETGLIPLGVVPAEQIDYDLMALDRLPNTNSLSKGPQKLVLRRPTGSDIEALFPLQAGYEQEEVLPTGAVFNPASCRLSLEHIIANEQILIAELEGRILGKINTNAESFSRYQIGGVYILPEYRGLGIGSRLTAAFVRDIVIAGKGVSLFVKKQNLAARIVYRRIGFISLEDYRITYY
ncbi:MAG: GNAT family N-acetyltransferase [Treponema sp.]|jgi:predicted GNAT family acetyltransferase|nr:GNAT family N-acetyltransferase [Treponema sp.]